MSTAFEPGAVVAARYRLERVLGRGGMGIVWRAVDERQGVAVALKVMSPIAAGAKDRTDRFVREAKLAASIRDEHVVRVFDLFTLEDGSPVLVMELLEGESLRVRLERVKRFGVREACGIFLQVVSAVGAAHAAGVIHRDLKPENIFLLAGSDEPTGVPEVRVLDFGIAKLVNAEGEALQTTLTTTGAVMGTPQYMSPEQALAERDVDARTDVWSLGVILYECLSGQRPVEGRSMAYVLRQVALGDLVPLAVAAPDVPVPILDLVNRMLATKREERPADLREVLETLRPYAAEIVVADVRPPKRSADVRRVAAAAAVAVLVLGGAGRAVWSSLTRSSRGAAGTAASHEKASACVAARDCARDGGGPARCIEGACVALASPDCTVHADPAVLEDDATVWIGSMFPTSPDGALELAAVDLARKDFDQMMSVFARANPDAHVRPFGLVACDDTVDPMRAARHLVNDVRVPAIVGMNTAAEVIDVTGGVLLPKRVLAVVSRSTSPLITEIPNPPDAPRLVWRTTFNNVDTASAIGLAVPGVLEPKVRAQPGALAPGAPMRVALLRVATRGGTALTQLIFDKLRFNGRSALDNGRSFREFVFDEADTSPEAATARVRELLDFAPQVVVLVANAPTYERVLAPLETQWPAGAARPYYLLITELVPETREWVGATVERRRRFFGFEPVFSGDVNARFVMHFNESSPVKVTPDYNTNSSYDAFYLVAYATYALGGQPVTGANLGRAIARLVPPGKRVAVGPGGIYGAYEALRAGGNIDLEGAMGSLDFDVKTGDAPSDQALLCVDLDPETHLARSVESGVVYRGAAGTLDGKLRCP
jgi:hypothetical protein